MGVGGGFTQDFLGFKRRAAVSVVEKLAGVLSAVWLPPFLATEISQNVNLKPAFSPPLPAKVQILATHESYRVSFLPDAASSRLVLFVATSRFGEISRIALENFLRLSYGFAARLLQFLGNSSRGNGAVTHQ